MLLSLLFSFIGWSLLRESQFTSFLLRTPASLRSGGRHRRGQNPVSSRDRMMASGSSDLSTRISAEDQNIDERFICKTVLEHFKKCKVEISDAIKTTFPFLELLRDHGFISNKIYEDCEDSSRNQVPVQRVVYSVLCELEKTFDLPLLEVLFSNVIRRTYPGLNNVYESFRNVIKEKIFHQASDRVESVDGRNIQLKLEPGTVENSLSWMYTNTWNDNDTTPSENALSEHLCETEQMNSRIKDTTSDNNDALESQQAGEQRAQDSEPAERRHEDSLQSSVKENPGAGSSSLRSDPDEKNTMNLGNNSTLGKAKRKRGFKKHTDGSVNFHWEILPVTCGEMKGMLHKNKFKQGSMVKSIKREDGNWFTPREFEIEGGYKKSSHWKLSVRCSGRPIKWLIEKGFLPDFPRTHSGKKKKNSAVCEICQKRGKLSCCGTCARFFHENCHLPPMATQSLGSCTFCRMKMSTRSQECHMGSEVLARKMGPEEQLRCEFLLLKVYCRLGGPMFKKIPRDIYKKEIPQCVKELKMFNKIKKKLNERSYHEVGLFMMDMYRIFENHRACVKCNYFGLMGIRLEKEFEKNFMEVFAIQDTNGRSSQV
ncbi:nuclear body protein SP140-like protein isoform X2 [Rhinolophus ferrumequinum]|uniref:nuclear body protein SP140-like protein isoform X2 n=1 Tax=Rhinolophus ferrumequinum TaxID=59479 RepID=UPI00140FCFC8|nr:nuclear body protein SP140-like protein isoform X2 [Rhinolophus ferrumequinum]